MNKTKVSIIGANSYIARNLMTVMKLEEFQVQLYDYQESSLDNYSNYTQVNIMHSESVNQIDVDCDILFMFSGMTGTSNGFDQYESFIDLNEKGLLNVLKRLTDQRSKAKIIFPSTRLIYKGVKNVALTENAEKEFKTVYAINKFACEKYMEMYKNAYDIKYCICRVCIPYGNMVERVSSYGTIEFFLSKALKKENITLYGDGLQKRSFIHIYDLCQMMLMAALDRRCEGEAFNIGGPDTLSILQVAESIASKYNVHVEHLEWPLLTLKLESGDTIFDSSKIENILGYRYQYNYAQWIGDK